FNTPVNESWMGFLQFGRAECRGRGGKGGPREQTGRAMTSKIERSLEELYREDAERADAVVFGRRPDLSRRGFLNGPGLAGLGAAVGASFPFAANTPAGLVPAAFAQTTAPPAPPTASEPKILDFPGKEKGLVVLGDRPLVAETPEHLLNDDTTPAGKFFIRNNGQIPEAAKEPDG